MKLFALTSTTIAVIILALSILSAPLVQAQSGVNYDLSWSTVDNGGNSSNGGQYALVGTIGQPDVGVALSGDDYILTGGFWGESVSNSPELHNGQIYLPLMLR